MSLRVRRGRGITFTLNGAMKAVDLALEKDVPDPGFGWRLAYPGGLGA